METILEAPDSASPRALSDRGAHEAVLRLLQDEALGKVLDAPAGEGHLAEELARRGHDVTAIDLNTDQVRGRRAHYVAADLNGTLPFADGDFDLVACVESIEHLENPHNLVREFFRVLRPGGALIVTTPNVMSLESRLQNLFLGWPVHFAHWVHRTAEEDPLNFHINPVSYLELQKILRDSGFKVETIATNRLLRRRRLMMPLASLVRRATTTWLSRRKIEGFREILSDELLFGKLLIVKARKP